MNLTGPLTEQQWAIMCALLVMDGATQRELMRHLVSVGTRIDRRVFHIQLGRLEEKGLIRSERLEKGYGRPHRYWSKVTREQLVSMTVGDLFAFLPLQPEDRQLVLELFDERFEEPELAEASSR